MTLPSVAPKLVAAAPVVADATAAFTLAGWRPLLPGLMPAWARLSIAEDRGRVEGRAPQICAPCALAAGPCRFASHMIG